MFIHTLSTSVGTLKNNMSSFQTHRGLPSEKNIKASEKKNSDTKRLKKNSDPKASEKKKRIQTQKRLKKRTQTQTCLKKRIQTQKVSEKRIRHD